MTTIAVTGASGFVGAAIVRHLAAAGHDVLPLVRPAWKLGERSLLPADVTHVVHCAWDLDAHTTTEIERVNVGGSKRLIDDAQEAGARVIFVSTLSAFPGARSHYGRSKLAVEDAVAAAGGVTVRPGLVWDETGRSLYGKLRKLALSVPALPVFTGEERKLHLVHADDLGRSIARVTDTASARATPLVAASRDAHSLADILRMIAAAHGRTLRTPRVPWVLAWAPLRALESVGVSPPFRSDSVMSLVSLDQSPFLSGTLVPDVDFRPFEPR